MPMATAVHLGLESVFGRGGRVARGGDFSSDWVAAGSVSLATVTLMRQATRTMMITKLKMAAAALLTVGALTCVATSLAATGPTGLKEPVAASPRRVEHELLPPPAIATGATEPLTFQGRVLGPSGQPVLGAKL